MGFTKTSFPRALIHANVPAGWLVKKSARPLGRVFAALAAVIGSRMFIVALACILLLALTTVTHYEALSSLNTRLVSLAIPNRSKLLVVISTAFMAHALEMTLYGLTIYLLTKYFGVGALSGPGAEVLVLVVAGPAADRLVGVVHLHCHGAFLESGRGAAPPVSVCAQVTGGRLFPGAPGQPFEAASASAWSTRSQLKPGSARPKWP